jgi:uncharacterized protein YqgC (DUF456 family)
VSSIALLPETLIWLSSIRCTLRPVAPSILLLFAAAFVGLHLQLIGISNVLESGTCRLTAVIHVAAQVVAQVVAQAVV